VKRKRDGKRGKGVEGDRKGKGGRWLSEMGWDGRTGQGQKERGVAARGVEEGGRAGTNVWFLFQISA